MHTVDLNNLANQLIKQHQSTGNNPLFGFTVSGIIVSLFFSGIGFVYLRYGKLRENTPAMICGAIMIVYPYFISSTLLIILIGLVLSIFPIILNR